MIEDKEGLITDIMNNRAEAEEIVNQLENTTVELDHLKSLVPKELKHKKEVPTVIEYQGRRYVLDHGNK